MTGTRCLHLLAAPVAVVIEDARRWSWMILSLAVWDEDSCSPDWPYLAVPIGRTMIGMDLKFCGLYCGALE